MRFKEYIRLSLAETLLCIISAASLCVCVLDGFDNIELFTARIYPTVLLCAIIIMLAYIMSFNRKTIICGIILLILSAIVALIALNKGNDTGVVLYSVITALTSLAVFFMTRTGITAAAMYVLGVLFIVGDAFLQFAIRPINLVLFLIFGACLLVMRLYNMAMIKNSAYKVKTIGMALIAIIICIASALLSGSVYFLIIKPVSPPTYELKLETELKKLPLLEKVGVASTLYIIDTEHFSQEYNDDKLISSENKKENDDNSRSQEEENEENTVSRPDFEKNNENTAVRYELRSYTVLYIVLFLALSVIAALIVKLITKKLRFCRLRKMDMSAQMIELYYYFLRLMGKCGVPPHKSDTPMEYCHNIVGYSERFFETQEMFFMLTESFERILYGGKTPDCEEYERFLRVYKAFPSRCIKAVGFVKKIAIFFVV